MPIPAELLREPIALPPNRLRRFYRGGARIDVLRGTPPDDAAPEDWVGSATRAWTPPGVPHSTEGPSPVKIGQVRTTLEDLLADEPAALAGPALVDRAGPTLGVLVKLLDAGERLPVHAHPSRRFAARHLGSPFGKTEAWLILETPGGGGRIWAGMRDGVGAASWRAALDAGSGDALLPLLEEASVRAGDVILVPAGCPHAIGSGILLLELQEPTDFSIVAEVEGVPIDPAAATLHLGWDTAAEAFDPAARPSIGRPSGDASLLPLEAAPFFRLFRQTVGGTAAPPFEPAYAVGVVVRGSGELRGVTHRLPLRRGTTVALPAAAVATARITGEAEIAWCLGPDPEALDRDPLPRLDGPSPGGRR